ncbi:MAG: hypothetical protein EOM23_09180, partial [Candidatus Moranbacteria bacterium]|nr:hypothetical protein [Candidatus Moranbacteria bacterium]
MAKSKNTTIKTSSQGSAKKCSVDGCDGIAKTRGFCVRHYKMFMRHGRTDIVKKTTTTGNCSVLSCERKAVRWWGKSQYCYSHWSRLYLTGDLKPDVPLRKRVFGDCSIDGCDKEAKRFANNKQVCNMHYERYRNTGMFDLLDHKRCKTPGCVNASRSKRVPLCNKCYRAKLRSENKKEDIVKQCDFCGETIYGSRRVYCSDRCRRQKKRSEFVKACCVCGKKITLDTTYKGIGKNVVCSKECRGEQKNTFKKSRQEWEQRHYSKTASYEEWHSKIAFAEKTKKARDGSLICFCTYCGIEFTPLWMEVRNRYYSLMG